MRRLRWQEQDMSSLVLIWEPFYYYYMIDLFMVPNIESASALQYTHAQNVIY